MLPTAYFLGMLLVFFHPKHKRLGDMAAGTIVVHERQPKHHKKQQIILQEIEARGLHRDQLSLEDWAIQAITAKDWKLLKTYCQRLSHLKPSEKHQMTRQVAMILFPKTGLVVSQKKDSDIENQLLLLYLHLKDEWEYEL